MSVATLKQEIIDWFVSDYEYKEDYVEKGEEPYFSSVWEPFYDSLYSSDKDKGGITLPSGYAYLIDSYGGEGKGEDYWVVFQVGDKAYRMDGYYSSWEGGNWDSAEPYEVKPVEVTVIKYKKA